jgi:hypothetical protein
VLDKVFSPTAATQSTTVELSPYETLLKPNDMVYDINDWSVWNQTNSNNPFDTNYVSVLANGGTPTQLKVVLHTHFTYTVTLRAHTVVSGIDFDVTLPIRVCGEETVNILTSTFTRVYPWVDTTAPLYVNEYNVPESYMHISFFEVLPLNDPCVINDIKIGTEYFFIENTRKYLLTAWPVTNQQVVLAGSSGSFELKFDVATKGWHHTFDLVGITRGHSSGRVQMEIACCWEYAHQKTKTYSDISEFIVPRYSHGNVTTLDPTDWTHMIEMVNCTYCEQRMRWKVTTTTDSWTDYSDAMVYMDPTTRELKVTQISERHITNRMIYLTPYWDSNLHSDCLFLHVNPVPLNFEVCGSEAVLLTDKSALQLNFTWRIEGNAQVTNVTDFFEVAKPSKCKLNYFELWPNSQQTLAQYGKATVWENFISVNSSTGVVTIDFNANPVFGSNATYEVYFVAYSWGKQKNIKPLEINIIYNYENRPPTFFNGTPPAYLKFIVEEEKQIKKTLDPA